MRTVDTSKTIIWLVQYKSIIQWASGHRHAALQVSYSRFFRRCLRLLLVSLS